VGREGRKDMREITRIITVQITDIAMIGNDFDFEENRERVKKTCGGVIKELIGVDDVVIVDIQDFVRDIECDHNESKKIYCSIDCMNNARHIEPKE
jgi:hypothetical protein